MSPNDAAIAVDGLCKSFAGKPAVSGVSLAVRFGEIFGFLGPNGSGKTTTMRMLCGLLLPDAGSGRCLGFDIVRQAAAIKQRIGYMSQRFSLYDDLTVRENLQFVCRIYGLDNGEANIEQALVEHGLEPYAGIQAGMLSGGWKQRLALAAALLHEPELLILDEPTSGIDPEARRSFWHIVRQLAARGLPILVSTHYLDEVEQYCDRMAYILGGRLLVQGSLDEVLRASGLTTLRVTPPTPELAVDIAGLPGVAQVMETSEALFVSGEDGALLSASLGSLTGIEAQQVRPRLEDVFMHLAGRG